MRSSQDISRFVPNSARLKAEAWKILTFEVLRADILIKIATISLNESFFYVFRNAVEG